MSHGDDWQHAPEWDLLTREVFEEKLRRQRDPHNRAESLEAKATALFQTGDPALRPAARALWTRILDQYAEAYRFHLSRVRTVF
jgi:hypothetical protein